MAIKIIKDIFLCTLTVVLFFNVLYANSESKYKPLSSRSMAINDYPPLKMNFNTNEINMVHAKWQKYNTGTYVYVRSSFIFQNLGVVIFVYQNKVFGYALFSKSRNREPYKLYTGIDFKKTFLKRHGIFRPESLNSYLIDYRFKDLSIILNNSSPYHYCYTLDVSYSKKKNYIAVIELKEIRNTTTCKLVPIVRDIKRGMYVYSYGLLMLPKETNYTDKVVENILKKYKQAMECEQRLLDAKKTKKIQNLTLLEKAVGKEKIECMDRYLAWDRNISISGK